MLIPASDALSASIGPGKLNIKGKLRTLHQLPDSHPLLQEDRVTDDPCPYLLAIWTTGATYYLRVDPQCISTITFAVNAKLFAMNCVS
ncbi:hypothetical protein DCAR_0622665 [Daucus carota subsp. sativus]|uniref:Uncharacterized protein n=1 Tax=Daucus carota subsp. sativus TaxID=79200 RepID=A0AAF0XA46_DAUCS|nr:hypothetical protein DCAR_0622665 [Daucus carota subsp. sativus]